MAGTVSAGAIDLNKKFRTFCKKRYPERVKELKSHLAGWPHYDLIKKNSEHFWKKEGLFVKHLKNGSWDNGMKTSQR